jgi:two-component system nitrogen regulation response regulator GlnG
VTPVGGRRPEPVDVRIIAATHRDLDAAVAEGVFREDLLYRLRVVPMHIPPLRARREDIPVLAEHFLQRYADELAGGPRFFAPPTLEKLGAYDWPGNVRELENAVKRALVLASGEVLTPEDFDFVEGSAARGGRSLAALIQEEVDSAIDRGGENLYRDVLERVERPLLEAALARTDGNQIRAAALLGINRNTLRKKIVELAIPLPGKA